MPRILRAAFAEVCLANVAGRWTVMPDAVEPVEQDAYQETFDPTEAVVDRLYVRSTTYPLFHTSWINVSCLTPDTFYTGRVKVVTISDQKMSPSIPGSRSHWPL